MKIKEGFLLKEVADNYVVVPVGDVAFNGMLSLNETGNLIWKKLETGCEENDIVKAVLAEYDISEEKARADISVFLGKLREAGLLDE